MVPKVLALTAEYGRPVLRLLRSDSQPASAPRVLLGHPGRRSVALAAHRAPPGLPAEMARLAAGRP